MTAAVLLAIWSGAATAQFPSAMKARSVKASLVTAFEPCTAPTTSIWVGGDIGFVPACSRVRSDTVCSFGADGSGSVAISSQRSGGAQLPHTTQFGAKFKIKGLAGCEGERLGVWVRTRITNQSPGSGILASCVDCTSQDFIQHVLECTVVDGSCSARTFNRGVIEGDSNVEVLDCWVSRLILGDLSWVRAFNCGVLSHDSR